MPQAPEVIDPALPAAAVLIGPAATGLIEAAVSVGGGALTSLRRTQVRYVPAASLVVQYSAAVTWPGCATTRETLVASAGRDVPDRTLVLSAEGIDIAVWQFPNDPYLPGLPSAVDPQRAAELLASLGAEPGDVKLRTRAYRPGRRAVVEVAGHGGRMYLKVVRPSRVGALQARHAALAAHVPVPRSLGWSDELGIVALQALPGRPLRKVLEARGRRIPDAAALIALLDRFPAPGDDTPHVAGPCARVGAHAAVLGAIAPDLADPIHAIERRIAALEPEGDDAVHGDFHSAQLLVDGATITGLVDVDTSGVGSRADDLAVMLAHLSTLALGSPARQVIERYGAQLIAGFDRVTDPAKLRLRTAAAALGLATGPFHVQEPRWRLRTEARIRLVEQWISAADQVS